MILYEYVAKNQKGENISGKIEAPQQDQAAKILRDRKLVIISLKESRSKLGEISLFNQFFGRTRSSDLVTFTRQLSTMIASGLPLAEALDILRSQSRQSFANVVKEVLRDVQGGVALADAMAKHKTFPSVYVALVRAGESAGVLDEVLLRLADNLEKQQAFRAKTRGALIYPAIIMIGMGAVAFVMMVFVIPQLSSLYDDFGAELPLPTKILIAVSSFVAKLWFLVIAGVAVGIWGYMAWRKTEKGKFTSDKWKLALPIFGALITKIILAEFTRTLALLLGAGITILEALNIVSDSVGNEVYKRELKAGAVELEKGGHLAETLARSGVFPMIIPQMISVGEETGKLDEVLMKVSNYFETEAEQAIKNLTTALEPLIMVLLGLGVGFIVISIILPIYNLTSQI